MSSDQTRAYDRNESVVFLKTKEAFGGLSNMAGGFPLRVNGIRILTSEALYQACRFPHMPEVQRIILGEASPMTAKMKSKPYRGNSRQDWDRVRVKVMRWCLRVKLAQNWLAFSNLLLETEERPIVEESRKDDFWGAKPMDGNTLVGMNVLGRLLMGLREEIKVGDREAFRCVEPLAIPDFLLDGGPIDAVRAGGTGASPNANRYEERKTAEPVQPSFFDQPAVRESPAPYASAVRNRDWGVAGLKPYPEMKDSGVSWLGVVPAHWEVRRLKYVLRERDTRSKTGAEQLLRVSQYTGVTERKRVDGVDEADTRASSLLGYKVVEPEDLVVNIMLAWNGSMGVSSFYGIASPAYCVYRFDARVQPWYFHHLLRSPAYKARIKTASRGVVESRLRLYTDDMFRLEALLPPQEEQAAIVRFINHTDRRIRWAIQAKQKLIALLREQKQAIIHRAVTRGLDPAVRLKPSGVEWLGDVPEHWEVRRIKSLSIVKRGASPRPIADLKYFDDEGEYSWVRIADVTASGRYLEMTTEKLSELGRSLSVSLEPGALFLSIAGSVGKPVITRIKCCIHDGFVYFPQLRGNVEYLCRIFESGAPFAGLGKLGTQLNLNTETVGSIRVPWPSAEEQTAIAAHLDEATEQLSAAVQVARREISLLREYRTRLIADVVTGKLDVREAAARLPDAVEAADAVLDDAALVDEGDEDAAEAADEAEAVAA